MQAWAISLKTASMLPRTGITTPVAGGVLNLYAVQTNAIVFRVIG